MNDLKTILVAYQNGERGLPNYHELAAMVEHAPAQLDAEARNALFEIRSLNQRIAALEVALNESEVARGALKTQIAAQAGQEPEVACAPPNGTIAKWISSPEGRRKIDESIAGAQADIDELNKSRRITPERLNTPMSRILNPPVPDLINIGSMRYQGKSVADWVIEAKAVQAGPYPVALLQRAHDEIAYLHKHAMRRAGDTENDGTNNSVCVDIRKALSAAPPAPANALAIVQAALEAAANLAVQWGNAREDKFGGHALRNCAEAIRAVDKQSILAAMEGKS